VREEPENCQGLTRSQKILWYRNNQHRVEFDNFLCSNSSNYRQLQLARGGRAVQETLEEKMGRDRTKSEALLWYRYGGGLEELEEQQAKASLCGTWQQYHLMTRGRAEPRDPEQELTKSESLLWYRNGGKERLEARDSLARQSNNWKQYQLTRDTEKVAGELEHNMNTRWSQFNNKEELSDYIAAVREEGMTEREEIRSRVRSRVLTMGEEDSITKQVYQAHLVEEEEGRREEAALRAEERVERLRKVTDEMITARTEYMVSTRELAIRAIKEDEEAVAASRMCRKKTTVVQQEGTVAA